jgi:hypothetical protein
LEYIRKILLEYHFLFAQHRKAITFPLPQEVGPFLVQQRIYFSVVEEKLKKFDFDKGEGWVYDPHGVISQGSQPTSTTQCFGGKNCKSRFLGGNQTILGSEIPVKLPHLPRPTQSNYPT